MKQIAEVATTVVNNNVDEIKSIAQDPKSPVIQVWIASVALHGIKKGDMTSLSQLLDRIIGRPKDHIVLSGDEHSPLTLAAKAAQQMTPEERITEIKRLQAMREKASGD